MRYAPVLRIIGVFITALGLTMAAPVAVDLATGNSDWQVFTLAGGATIFIGVLLITATGGREMHLDRRQGFLLAGGSWLAISAFAALPFVFSNASMSPADAWFEAVSGLTTTGSTVMTGLDTAPYGLLLWRGILQWVGGVGIIVMGIALLPFLKVGGMQLFQLESSEREKVLPRVRQFAGAVAGVYLTLTMLCAASLMLCGLGIFDAIVHAMTALATGGFANYDTSIAHFRSPAVEWTLSVFMLCGAMPFVMFVRMLHGRRPSRVRDVQAQAFLGTVAAIIAVVTVYLWLVDGKALGDSARLATFNIISVITTTGFVSDDYMKWGPFAVAVFFFITFVGGCTGSTGGGIKIFRFAVLWQGFKAYARQRIYPHEIRPPMYGGRPIADDVFSGVLMFLVMLAVTVTAVSLVLSAMGLDLVTSVTAAATAVGNVGPGLGPVVGPTGNFASLPEGAKWLLALAMLLGRLEYFTLVVMLQPAFWRD